MAKQITLSRARYLAEQSSAVAHNQGDVAYARPKPSSYATPGPSLPWHLRHMAALVVGGIFTGVFLLLAILISALNSDGTSVGSSDVEVLAGVMEKMVDAGMERTRIEEQRQLREEQRKKAEEERRAKEKAASERAADQQIMQMIFYSLLAVIFIGVSSQYSNVWGIGIGLFVLGLILVVVTVPGVKEAAQFVMER